MFRQKAEFDRNNGLRGSLSEQTALINDCGVIVNGLCGSALCAAESD